VSASRTGPPTPQQDQAIRARSASVVLSSGAGCGKTFVLTNRYLSHLKDDGARVHQIVAITFTDRAARQMRGRIRDAIAKEIRSNPADPKWADHLCDLESASIQTIHSFCADLLRQFAVPAGLDPAFEVLEEILAENLRAEALRDTLQSLLTAETPAGQDLRELVVLYGWTQTVDAVESLLHDRDAAPWTQWLLQSPKTIAATWAGPERQALLSVWIEYLCAASAKIAHLINLFRSTECRGPDMQADVDKILDGLPKLASARDLAAAVQELCEAAKVGRERADAWPDADAYEAVKRAMSEFRADLPEKLQLFLDEPEGVEDAARVGQRFLRVALTVVEAYQQRKAQAGVVDFQDLLVLARDLLRDRVEVRESLQRRYRYLLLDEMQDTDPVQLELVKLLCGAECNRLPLFSVGDSKQSIYRFRGADVALFDGLRSSARPDDLLQLTRNYRSQPGILQFVNALCSMRFANYEPLEADRPALYAGACVEFLWSVPAANRQVARKETVTEIRAREADAIARRIVELIADTKPRVVEDDSLRTVTPGDIVLLFRSMSNVGIYEAALRRHGLDYYLVGGRAFFAQQEIYDLLNLLRALENPGESVALAGTLRSPFGCLSDDALLLLALHPDGLWSGLHDTGTVARLPTDQRPRAERIRNLLDSWRALKDRLPIARLIGRVFADTGYDAAMQFEFLGDRKLANLWKLIDLARTFDRSELFGLADFIARLGELVKSQPREEQAATQPENADVIKIMSIHQAKGLEFPVVFVPDLAATGLGGILPSARWNRRLGCLARPPEEDPPLFSDFPHRLGLAADTVADWREDLRILYVACTRAADLLVLSAGLREPLPSSAGPGCPVPVKAANSWMLAVGERFQLASGECLDSTIPPGQRPRVDVRIVEPDTVVAAPARRTEVRAVPEFRAGKTAPIPPSPWPAVVSLDEVAGSEKSRFRTLLGRWDLKGALPACDDPATADMLHRFAASEWPARLATAEELFRDMEFIGPWPGPDGVQGPAVRGTLDFLWKEADGWHMLALDDGDGRLPTALDLKARLVAEQFGEPPASVTTFDVRTGAICGRLRASVQAMLQGSDSPLVILEQLVASKSKS